ncbi:hypothetical protein ACFFRR_002164 [Megaselia abdita]
MKNMEDQKKIINKGILTFEVDGDRRSEDCFNHGIEIPLSRNYVRIPELKIDGFIYWKGSRDIFRLVRDSRELLSKNGKEMFIRVRREKNRKVFTEILSVFGCSSYEDLGFGDCGVTFGEMELEDLEFTLLDEFERDFALNPFYDIKSSSENQITKLHEDFHKLFLNPKHSDVTLKCKDGGNIKAHKIILISRSVFFEKMFNNENIESKSNEIHFSFKTEVMRNVLEFLYSGGFDGSMVFEVYKAADFFDLTGLKFVCEEFLFQNMTQKNIFPVLRFAETLKAEDLKKRALSWISWSSKYVKKSKEYSTLKKLASKYEFGFGAKILKLVDDALKDDLIGKSQKKEYDDDMESNDSDSSE